MRISRREVLVAGAAASAATVLKFPASAAEFSFKLGNDTPPTHPQTLRAIDACDKIRQGSNGQLDIQVFPGSQLGGQAETLSQVRLGAIQLLQCASVTIQSVLPVAGIDSIGFAFANSKELWNAMDGGLGRYTRAATEKLGLYVFDKMWDAGMREVLNSKRAIYTPDDMKGLKIRVPASPVLVSLFKSLGASPTAIDATSLYAALQTHLVDGLEVPLVAAETGRYYEQSKYVSYTNHSWTGYRLLASADGWRKLPKNLQDMCEREFNAAALAERADLEKMNQSLETSIKGHGLTFNDVNVAPFRAQVRRDGLYAQWRDLYGPEAWGLLERSVGKLT